MIWLLGEIDAPHLMDVVIDCLKDHDPLIRAEAVRTLGKKAPAEVIRKLTPMLDDEDFNVRQAVQSVIRERLNLEYLIKK
jgi:HEAT repeat protein